jgi:putative tricarboxylic transport membrane protein
VKKADAVSAVIGMVLSGAVFIKTLGFKKFKTVPVGPEVFPRYLATGLFICSAVLLVKALLAKPGGKPEPTINPLDKGIQRLLIGLVIIVVYAICWEPLGFIIITPVSVFALLFLLGVRKYLAMAIFSVCAMATIFCAFRFFLGIEMPMGLLYGLNI